MKKVERTRPKQIHLWLSAGEHRQLCRVAKREGMSASALLRLWILSSIEKPMSQIKELR